MVEVEAIVLAAGRASRFGAGEGDSKVCALLEGRPLVTHVVAAASASRVCRVIVVTGQGAERTAAALAGWQVTLVHNSGFAEGMAGSLVTGLAAVSSTAEAVLVLLADMPRVRSATIDALVATFEAGRPDAVVPRHEGRRGNPVLLARSLFPALGRLQGDEGARRLLSDPGRRIVELVVDDPGILVDVDTREALATLDAASQAASRPAFATAGSKPVVTQPAIEIRASISSGGSGGAK